MTVVCGVENLDKLRGAILESVPLWVLKHLFPSIRLPDEKEALVPVFDLCLADTADQQGGLCWNYVGAAPKCHFGWRTQCQTICQQHVFCLVSLGGNKVVIIQGVLLGGQDEGERKERCSDRCVQFHVLEGFGLVSAFSRFWDWFNGTA